MTSSERISQRAAHLERHLARVAELLPESPGLLLPMTEASDGIVLHLWQAVQTCIDLAVSECVERGLGPPSDYGDAFLRLATARVISDELADRLVRAAGFRNLVAHGYDSIDLKLVWEAASEGGQDLMDFVRHLARATQQDDS